MRRYCIASRWCVALKKIVDSVTKIRSRLETDNFFYLLSRLIGILTIPPLMNVSLTSRLHYLDDTQRNPVCSKPVSGDVFMREVTRYPLQ